MEKGSRAKAEKLLNQKSGKKAEQALWDLVKEVKSEAKANRPAKTACLDSIRSTKECLN